MDLTSLAGFIGLSLINAIVPGPNMLLALRALLTGGLKAARAAVGGIAIGMLVYGIGSTWGLAQLIGRWPWLLDGLLLIGAGWVYWLGIGMVRRGIRGRPLADELGETAEVSRRAFVMGLTTALVNPTVAVFFLTVVPRFTGGEGDGYSSWGFLAMVLLYIDITALTLLAVVASAKRYGRVASGKRTATVLHLVLGAALMGFGILLLPAG